jgi:glycosyltransferase involved in cell wall biosynthesis
MNESGVFSSVLFVAPHYKWWKGGISSVIQEYKNAIPEFNFFASTSIANIYVTALLFPYILMNYLWVLRRNRKIEIVHIHGASKGSFYRKYLFFLIAKYLYKKKVIYHIHGARYHLFYQSSPAFLRRRITHMVNGSDALIVLSTWWKDFFMQEFKPKKIEIIPNIVGYVSYEKKRTSISSAIVKLLFLGRIGERKGIFDLLEVLRDDVNFYRTHSKLLVGGDGEIDKLKKLIESYQLSDIVDYIGFVSGDKKKEILSSSDIYILPSYNEGLPISVLEAMAFAKPVISTKVGGIPEIVHHGVNGFLISAGNKKELADCLKRLILAPSVRDEFGFQSYNLVKNTYFPDTVLMKLSSLYTTLV